jgi:NAD(P)-dependent dehydrogenase (short-subunit alcohol dehydrogenase family)
MFSLFQKCAVVIGGTTGIGRAISLGLAQAGADVIASSRRQSQVDEVADMLEKSGKQTLRIPSDVQDRQSLIDLKEKVVAKFGKIDILVNCAGITKRVPTLDCPEETWGQILDINLTGTLRACQVFGQAMVERRYGRVINIASLSSFLAFYEVAAYSASKAAVASLTKSLAIEWAEKGVTVNAIAPGIFPTELNSELLLGTERGTELLMRTPMRRFGKAEEVIGAAVFLASDASAFVTGEILAVDGGFLASGVNR